MLGSIHYKTYLIDINIYCSSTCIYNPPSISDFTSYTTFIYFLMSFTEKYIFFSELMESLMELLMRSILSVLIESILLTFLHFVFLLFLHIHIIFPIIHLSYTKLQIQNSILLTTSSFFQIHLSTHSYLLLTLHYTTPFIKTQDCQILYTIEPTCTFESAILREQHHIPSDL